MPFTVQELENISNAALEYHMDRGRVEPQSLQNKPLLKEMRARKRIFPGGKENITVRVKGDYTTTLMGYTHDDQVSYQNPANIKKATYPWKEIHAGIQVTLTELKEDGISVVDSATGKSTVSHTGREMTMLANILENKLDDMAEGYDRGMNLMYWRDGTQDTKQCPGVKSFLLTDPTSGTIVGGIDQGNNTWWRNRAVVGINAGTPANQNVTNTLQSEFRQLRRYGDARHVALAGSDFLTAFEKELKAQGYYTQSGWAKDGRIDASISELAFKGVAIDYDPTLDDEGESKYCYVLDTKHILPMVMEGEEDKMHNPARPHNIYALYRAKTWTGGLICRKRVSSGVYSIA